MISLLNLLLKERWRRSAILYGWPARLTIFVLLLLFAVGATPLITRLLDAASAEQVGLVFGRLVTTWIVTGVLIGKDLTWQTRLDRLTFFPLSFHRLYILTLLLGFLSFPLVVMLCVLEVAFYGRGIPWIGWLLTFLGFWILVCCVRATISIVRTAIFKRHSLRKSVRNALWLLIAFAGVLAIASSFDIRVSQLSPGYQLALVLLGINPGLHLTSVTAQAALLVCGDFFLQREVVYSGLTGPPATRVSNWSSGRFLLFRPSPSTTLWRMSLLGWIRSPNVVLMMMWGAGYSFVFLRFNAASGQAEFIAFSLMVLIFHGYLRGNLLGVDHKSAWFYFMLPVNLEETIRAKNSSLTLLQMLVVAAVLLPAVLRTTPGLTAPLEWMAVLSYIYSTILVGEIVGSIYTIRRPQPIVRTSLYSGTTTPGAFVVPGCQLLFLAIFVACNFQLPAVIAVVLLTGVPAFLWVVRSAVLRSWVHTEMTKQRDNILSKLSRNTT